MSLDGGFKRFVFSSLFREGSHFDSYFSDWLKPPSSIAAVQFLLSSNPPSFGKSGIPWCESIWNPSSSTPVLGFTSALERGGMVLLCRIIG